MSATAQGDPGQTAVAIRHQGGLLGCVPALRDVVKIKFGVEYASDSSYQLLMRFLGMSFKLPDLFDKRRDEAAITARMAQIRQEVAELLTRGTARSSLHLRPITSIAAVRVRGLSPRRGQWGDRRSTCEDVCWEYILAG